MDGQKIGILLALYALSSSELKQYTSQNIVCGISSRGDIDSKIGKKWPESSRILDYILC